MKNKIFITAFIFVILIIFGLYLNQKEKDSEGVFCTMEAKMCPDGSYVGRSGPKCEFAACPSVQENTKAKIDQTILINGVYITPLEVSSDSRCPGDVVCIWAGEVQLKARLSDGSSSEEVVLKQWQEAVLFNKKIKLTEVSPGTNSKKTISPNDYVFEFSVE